MPKDKDKKDTKALYVFNPVTKEGFLIEAPEGWEIDGEPRILLEGLITFPVEKKI